jgi:hypothetical protein
LSDVAPLLSGLWVRPGPTASSSTDEEPYGSHIDSDPGRSGEETSPYLALLPPLAAIRETRLVLPLRSGASRQAFLLCHWCARA